MIPAMREQFRRASRCAPMVPVPDSLPVRAAAEELLILNDCAVQTDRAAGAIYLPLR